MAKFFDEVKSLIFLIIFPGSIFAALYLGCTDQIGAGAGKDWIILHEFNSEGSEYSFRGETKHKKIYKKDHLVYFVMRVSNTDAFVSERKSKNGQIKKLRSTADIDGRYDCNSGDMRYTALSWVDPTDSWQEHLYIFKLDKQNLEPSKAYKELITNISANVGQNFHPVNAIGLMTTQKMLVNMIKEEYCV